VQILKTFTPDLKQKNQFFTPDLKQSTIFVKISVTVFERNIIIELKKWVARHDCKPLILRGSRQVGKTTLVDSFSQNFENYLYLNFEKNPSATTLFEKEQEIDALMAEVFLFCNKENKPGKTLLFIDEIQNSTMAITRLRYFYEAKIPDLYVIAAGSLL